MKYFTTRWLLIHLSNKSAKFRLKLFQCRVWWSVVSGLQHLSQMHGHLCPGGGAPPLGVSSVLDLCNALWLKVPRRGDPGGEGSREQHPLEDIQRQVRGGVRRSFPLGGVLKLPAGAVPPQYNAVPEVRHPWWLLWLEAHENGPRPGGWGWRLLEGGAPHLPSASWLALQWVLGMFWIRSVLIWWEALGVILAHQDSGGESL